MLLIHGMILHVKISIEKNQNITFARVTLAPQGISKYYKHILLLAVQYMSCMKIFRIIRNSLNGIIDPNNMYILVNPEDINQQHY